MPLNNSKGNMFDFVTHTWNPIKGACFHDCSYCYMKRWGDGRLKAPRLVKSELKADLGNDNFIFIGSSIDIFSNEIPQDWIIQVLCKTEIYDKNKYLLQTKSPNNYFLYLPKYSTIDYGNIQPDNFILSTTIETNNYFYEIMKNSPHPYARVQAMQELPKKYKRMLTIEPIMKFDLEKLLKLVMAIKPEQINVGADTQNKNLPEPSAYEVEKLIFCLKDYAKVNIKSNLNRILKGNEKK